MDYILLSISVVLASVKSLLSRTVDKKSQHLFNGKVFGFASLALLVVAIIQGLSFSWYTLGFAALYAVFALGAQLFFYQATRVGDVGVSSLVYYCGFIIPTVFSVIAWSENMGLWRIIGICLILFSFILATEKSKDGGGIKWFISAFLAMSCSGVIGIIQKVYMKSAYSGELHIMLVEAFVLVTLISFALYFFTERKTLMKEKVDLLDNESEGESKVNLLKVLIIPVVMSITHAACNLINGILAGALPGVIFFPAVNGGSILLAALGGIVFFKEQPTVRKISAIVIGFIAIILTVI